MLADAFPEYEVVTVNVGKALKHRPHVILASLPSWARAYGVDALRRRRGFRATLVYTPAVFRAVSRLVRHELESRVGDVAFTFQWQSLFDAHQPGVPHFVYTDHTVLVNLTYKGFDPSFLPARSWIEYEHRIYENADLVFTWSDHVTRSLVEQYGCSRDKARLVRTGPTVRARGELRNGGYRNKNVLFVGMDWERKGGPTLVDAFRLVLGEIPDARLTIVGCAPKLDLPNCTIVGRVPVEHVASYFEEASIFCLPTTLEPFGTVFLEAFDHALPVVATRIGAAPDFVEPGRNGFLVEPGDAKQLASTLCMLLRNPDRCRTFGIAGREMVRSRYDWTHVAAAVRENIVPFLAPANAGAPAARPEVR
jgi:glycosyltransferase involved in cell wall biosynthesis